MPTRIYHYNNYNNIIEIEIENLMMSDVTINSSYNNKRIIFLKYRETTGNILETVSTIHNNYIIDTKHCDNDVKRTVLLDAQFLIIDHGSVLYLILYLTLPQILLYNQQYTYGQSLYNNNNDINHKVTSAAVTFKACAMMYKLMYKLNTNTLSTIRTTTHQSNADTMTAVVMITPCMYVDTTLSASFLLLMQKFLLVLMQNRLLLSR